ncbi:GAF and ANTAR domain-containing protein [Rhodococcus sp. NPDC060086]|uniref:GAF and ANTAR domain-containing protein n=1 Tax=Rhodococcus sp. NPDC060086 TaxID=3347055 RepID=UPI00365FADB9
MRDEHASLNGTLKSITAAAVELIPGVEHAGITLVVGRTHFESRAATSELPRKIDELQDRLQDGPCVRSIWEKETVSVADLAQDDRWPVFGPEAAALGVGSMLAFRLYTAEDTLGALNLHSSHIAAFNEGSISVGSTLATHAAIALIATLREEQFHNALASRDIIGQAKGILMERFGMDADTAFGMLRTLSQERNEPLNEIALELVEVDHPPH